jgi:hypothetical protein
VRVSRQIATAAIAITAIAVWIGADSSILPPERHLDGQGPLASLNSSGPHGVTTVDPTQGSVWTFGYRLCLAQGDQPAVIDSIGPTQAVGSGFKYLGSLIRTFDVQPGVDSVHEPIGAVHGFPPPPEYAPDYLRPAIGYPVAILCSSGQPSPPVTYAELLVGLAAVGTNGGGWLGIDVGYTVGGRHRHPTDSPPPTPSLSTHDDHVVALRLDRFDRSVPPAEDGRTGPVKSASGSRGDGASARQVRRRDGAPG